MSKFSAYASDPFRRHVLMFVYISIITAIGLSSWITLQKVRVQLSSDMYGLTIDIIRTHDMTIRYIDDVNDYLKAPNGNVPLSLKQHLTIMETRGNVLLAPVNRMSLNSEFTEFFIAGVANYVQAVKNIETKILSGPLDKTQVFEVEDYIFAAEDAISQIYTQSQSYLQNRSSTQYSILGVISVLLVGLIVSLLLSLGWLVLILEKVRKQSHLLQKQALTDPLTGLFNRRHFNEIAPPLFATAQRGAMHLSLISIDIDHFKPFNDTYGHSAGDEALKVMAKVLKDVTMRQGDLAFRIGGEEFCCLVTTESPNDASIIAERIRAAIEQKAIPHKASPTSSVITASLGMASVPNTDIETLNYMCVLADEALYAAKNSGRNQSIVSEPMDFHADTPPV